jgi:ABC-2 type transport system ATP-binding protein
MATDAGRAIVTENLTKVFHGRTVALHGVNLELEPASALGILGQNGAGKTTLVKLLLGLHVPTAGRVKVFGQTMSPSAAQLRRRMGYLPADPKFPPGMSTIDYLDFVGRLHGIGWRTRRARVASLLHAVELLRHTGDPATRLSTGHRARLAIAASLINDPDILIWDEPAQGLDPEARRGMLELMKTLSQSKTLLLCSHNLVELQEVCSAALVLHDGKAIFHGPIEELQGAMRPGELELCVTGDRKEITEAFKIIQKYQELESASLNRNLITIRIRPDVSHMTLLANVLVTLADKQIELADLRIAGGQTEQAIVQLRQRETGRGISRATETLAAA